MGYPNQMAAAIGASRSSFLTRVYGFFLASVAMAGFGASVGMTLPFDSYWMLCLGSLLLLFFASAVRRTPGLNLVGLFAFTFVSGLSVGPLVHAFEIAGALSLVYKALGITAGAFVGLTLYVYIAREDFSWLGGFLWPALIGLLVAGIIGLFWPMSGTFELVYCYLGVLIFIGFTLYDTSNIVKNYPDDEYIAGAIALYLDFVNLFLFILRSLSLSSDD